MAIACNVVHRCRKQVNRRALLS